MNTIPIYNFSKGKSVPGFEVITWSNTVSSYEATKPHRHDYFELLFFLQGEGRHEIDFVEYTFHPRSIHFVAASCVHAVRRKSGSAGFSILFTPDFLPTGISPKVFPFFTESASPFLNLNSKEFEAIGRFVELIKEEYLGNHPFKRESLQSIFYALLIQLQRLYLEHTTQQVVVKPSQPFVQSFERLLEQHLKQHWRARDYAAALNMTVANLNTLCKKHLSKGTQSIINDKLTLEIKRLLAYSKMPVKEICFELNFEDPAYFNRFFKKETGLTPLQYREALSEH